MKTKRKLLFVAIIVVVFTVIYLLPLWNSPKLYSQKNDKSEQKSSRGSKWKQTTDYGIELWIAWTQKHDTGIGPGLSVFAFMEEKNFNEDNLRKLFARMAQTYSQYKAFSIEIYTDEEKLAWRVHDERFNASGESSIPGLPEQAKKPKNYFCAIYSRTVWPSGLVFEGFSYTPDRYKEDMIEIELKP